MEKTKKAVKYMIDVWDEVTGKTWRERPDHVQQKFLEAEKELLNGYGSNGNLKQNNGNLKQNKNEKCSRIKVKDENS